MEDEDNNDIGFLDDKEFKARFMLDPDVDESFKGQFSHLDKNLAITNLRFERNGMNEPEELRVIGRALHVLNNPVHFETEIKKVHIGYQDIQQKDGSILQVAVYRETPVLQSLYPKTFHNLKSEFLTFTNTSASRQGHRVKAAISNVRVKEESYEEKTNVAPRWSAMNKKPK